MTEFIDEAQERRLPVYLLLDCSGSMGGDPIEALRVGMQTIIDELKSDPQALQTAWLSVITFDSSARQVVPLVEIGNFMVPAIDATGTTALGQAFNVLSNCLDKEVKKHTATQKGDYKPLVFVLTDGEPTDEWRSPATALKKKHSMTVISCGAGAQANESNLKQFSEIVVMLSQASPGQIKAYFNFLTQSIKNVSQSVNTKGDAPVQLPSNPDPQNIVISVV